MADTLPTVWEAEPHTLAKHGILKTYLEAWAAILSKSRFGSELLFVDGFAGPGRYIGGELGSPLVALNSILAHNRPLEKSVRLRFIELDTDRHRHLAQCLMHQNARVAASSRIIVEKPILGDCQTEIRRLIAQRKRDEKPVGPALFFLDQFGYSQVPMSLIRAIMAERQCEVFSYLNGQRMNSYLSDKNKWESITNAYGDESWKAALGMSGRARQECLIGAYKNAIRNNAGTEYVWTFAVFNSGGQLIHWLVFATNHWNGLYEMKKAMWRADITGQYRFSDRVEGVGQRTFLSTLDDDQPATRLLEALAGQTLEESEVRDFVLTRTPYFNFKSQVNKLRTANLAAPRQAGLWPVTFVGEASAVRNSRHIPPVTQQGDLW